MTRTVLIIAILTAIACVSKRERGQSAFRTERTVQAFGRDSAWQVREQGAWSLELLELEAWIGATGRDTPRSDPGIGRSSPTATLTVPAGGNTGLPPGFSDVQPSQRLRLSRLTLRSDSATQAVGKRSDSAILTAGRTDSVTVSETRRAAGPGWSAGTGMALTLLAVLAVLVVRWLLR